jgi:beta-lactam-binding protein with PASTA domain
MTTAVHVEQAWLDLPSVHGLTVGEATERLTEAGFTPVASPRRFLPDSAEVVGGTLPPEGAALLRTARVDLLPAPEEPVRKAADETLPVDKLLELGIMPNLSGFTAEQAIAFVQARGFNAWPREAFSNKVDQGFVLFTEPRAGAAVQTNLIVIWVAVPPPPVEPFMPPEREMLKKA